jgi:hypothetical protein
MSRFTKLIAVSALVLTSATAAHAGGWGYGGSYGSYNNNHNYSNRQFLNVSPNVDVGGVLNGVGILSGNKGGVLNGLLGGSAILSGNGILSGNFDRSYRDNRRHYRSSRRHR